MAANGAIKKVSRPALHGNTESEALLQSFLAAHPDVRFIRYYVQDYCGVLRVRFTTRSRALQIAATPNAGVSTGSPILSAGLQSGGLLMELFQSGEDIWVPDWTSIHEFTASPGTATVFCDIWEHAHEAAGKDAMLARSPRDILRRNVNEALEKHGVNFLVGFEIEFYLTESPNSTESIDSPSGIWTSATIRVPVWRTIVEESVVLLEASGIQVWTFTQEGGKSKYEISLSPLPPLESVDAMHFAQETIKTLAQKAGCHATMHAKAFETGPTAGKHVHLSLSRLDLGTPFLAGVIKHFRALCGLMLSNVESYQRAEQFGQGAIVWGWNNKLTCVRRIEDAYFELRPPDSFANMYLTLAAIIGVGMKAVEDQEELTLKSMNDICYAAPPGPDIRAKYNIKEDLPTSLSESIAELKEDFVIKEVLGEKCFDRYIYNKEKDVESCKKMTTVERRRALLEQF